MEYVVITLLIILIILVLISFVIFSVEDMGQIGIFLKSVFTITFGFVRQMSLVLCVIAFSSSLKFSCHLFSSLWNMLMSCIKC